MALAIHWVVPFISINNRELIVNIYEKDYTGNRVQLIASETPFVTEETDDEDLLCPIRTQSGYINIYCNRDTWQAIINNGSVVTLTDEDDNIHWAGFISKEAFNGSVFNVIQEYQIPVHCIFTHLQSYKFVVSPFDTPTFAKVLDEAFSLLPEEVRPDKMIWHGAFCQSGDNKPRFLEHRIQRSNFYDSDKVPAANVATKSESTYYDVLSEICTYFGIVLCSQAQTILFLNYDEGTLYEGKTDELLDVDDIGVDAGLTTITEKIQTPTTIVGLESMTANNQESVLQPVHDVAITGNINNYKEFDAQYPEEVVKDWIEKHATDIVKTNYGTGYKLYTRSFNHPDWTEESSTGTFWESYSNALVTLKVYGALYSETYNAQITSRDYCENSEESSKVDYEFKNLLYTRSLFALSFGLYSNKSVALKSGSGAINFDYSVSTDATSPYGGMAAPDSTIRWKLKIGNKYWDGSAWTTAESTFTLGWASGNKDVVSNRALGDGYDGCKGMIIPISSDLNGKITLECYGGTVVYFESLNLKYVRKNANALGPELEGKTTIESKISTGVESLDEYTQECSFATTDEINGYGVVLGFNGRAIRTYDYANYEQAPSPEEFRRDFICNRMDRPLSVLNLEVKEANAITNRYNYIEESDNWSGYSIMSVGRDWAMETLRLKLIEL